MHTCDQEGDGAGLLKGGVADTNTNAHVHDLFHEDAQVGRLGEDRVPSEVNPIRFLYCWDSLAFGGPFVKILQIYVNLFSYPLYQIQAVVSLWSGLPAV